jgi:16S rRNA (guanine527-N7)-methyltransferase
MTRSAGGELPSRIRARGSAAGAVIDDELANRLAAYVEILARWNRKINLTALELEPPTDDAIDRLVIESVVAAQYVRPDEEFVLDVGSGGGSPALPLKLVLPRLRFVLVESKVRKAAFLREAVRHLELRDVDVENRRLEDLARGRRADLVTLRAVLLDAALAEAMRSVMKPDGRIFFFGSAQTDASVLKDVQVVPLVSERQSFLSIGY